MTDRLDALAVVPLQGDAKTAAARIDAALKQLGFFVVTDHGVPAAVIDRATAAAKAFFALDEGEKRRIESAGEGSPRGYIPMGGENLAATLGEQRPHDLREGFSMGPPRVAAERARVGGTATDYRPNRWPAEPADFETAVGAYYAAMEGLTARLMRAFAAALDLPPDYFDRRFGDHNSTLRLAYYPAQTTPPAPGQLRAGAHTDYGALTILLGEDRPGGLEVRTPNGRWLAARTKPHDFVINIGDLMMTWSNDRWLSNQHRVVNPPADAGPGAARLSLAYFCNPDDALEIACLPGCATDERPARYAPTTAGAHRMKKIEQSLAASRGA